MPSYSGFPRGSRRSFVASVDGGAALLAVPGHRLTAATRATDLSGMQFDLEIAELPVNFTGVPRRAIAVNGGVPGPLLCWKEGDEARVRAHNRHYAHSSIHWRGLIVSADMDGVLVWSERRGT